MATTTRPLLYITPAKLDETRAHLSSFGGGRLTFAHSGVLIHKSRNNQPAKRFQRTLESICAIFSGRHSTPSSGIRTETTSPLQPKQVVLPNSLGARVQTPSDPSTIYLGMPDQNPHRHPSPVRYFHATLPWPIELGNLSPGTTAEDLRAVLASYGDIVHCFVLLSKKSNPGAIIHFSDYETAVAAAEDLEGTCADGMVLQARLMSHKEQSSLTLLRRIS
ncbi:hypothetical protein PGT21_031708 [Puccinia graminis f. sp. tritici]|uniref:RRM domain-containing protein n=1 Tax=Puccinia graminis f. sp. tritici TaxID=56615 RepID=A0A5B0LQ54_PUCGR|nr:hypothetical protein PGT21_031708 [Puccinia graminis f. sp. tritici]KAA1081898.1 hypothetical protein PGTUg99_027051 [Puccinia graminis f. sp. tritici]